MRINAGGSGGGLLGSPGSTVGRHPGARAPWLALGTAEVEGAGTMGASGASGVRYRPGGSRSVTATRIGYARCSTDEQDLAAQRSASFDLGVAEDRICLDRGLTATTRARPGLDPTLAAVRAGAGRSGSRAPAPGSPAGCAYPPATPYLQTSCPHTHTAARLNPPSARSASHDNECSPRCSTHQESYPWRLRKR